MNEETDLRRIFTDYSKTINLNNKHHFDTIYTECFE